MGDIIETNYWPARQPRQQPWQQPEQPLEPPSSTDQDRTATVSDLTDHSTQVRAMLAAETTEPFKERLVKIVEDSAEQIRQGAHLEDLNLTAEQLSKLVQIYEQMPESNPSSIQRAEVISTLKTTIIKSLITLCRAKTATKKDAKILERLWEETFPEEREQFGITNQDIRTFNREAIARKAHEYFDECLLGTTGLPGGKTQNLYKTLEELEPIWPTPETFPGKKRHEVRLFICDFHFKPESEEQFKKTLESFGVSHETFMSIFHQEMMAENHVATLMFNFAAQGQRELRDIILNLTKSTLSEGEFEMVKKFLKRLDEEEPVIKRLLAQCRANRFDDLPELTNRLEGTPIPYHTSLRSHGYFGTNREEIEVWNRRAKMKNPGEQPQEPDFFS